MIDQFASEVLEGLSAPSRSLSSKWFYDKRGSALFQAIMAMPEYYLTDAEREIYQRIGPDLLKYVGPSFDLIELGAGDGTKTQHLIETFIEGGADFAYRPIDISSHALKTLGELIHLRWPAQAFLPLEGDYFAALDRLGTGRDDRRRLVLFPGANIGNFTPPFATAMLRRLRSFLRPGDLLLTGFDLKKDPAAILAAYDDPTGHTAAFNLNLLSRINRELGGDFDLDCWFHRETYDPESGAARSALVAKEAQTVRIGKLEQTFTFAEGEAIAVEISQKYSPEEIDRMAGQAGYSKVENFFDERSWFVDALWRA